MNSCIIRTKINTGYYNSKLPYPKYEEVKSGKINKEQNRRMITALHEDERRLKRLFEEDCRNFIEEKFNQQITSRQFKVIFNRAWEYGHSGGYRGILIIIEDLIDIIKEFS